jgi:GxxExxY protein
MKFHEFRAREQSGVAVGTEEWATRAIGAAIEVHRHLPLDLPESNYRDALCHEFDILHVPYRREVPIPIIYKGKHVGEGRADIIVADCLVLELKSVEALHPLHRAQALGYLRALRLQLALLMNFNVMVMRDGIQRVINSH